MKKQRINDLKLNKKIISNFKQEKIKGGLLWTWVACPAKEEM